MHMFEMRQLHWYHMQGRWVYTIKSCRSFPESFRHIIFAFRDLLERSGMVKPCQAMWSHVKPCQFAQEGNLGVVHMLLQQKALPSGFHWGPKGTRAPRKIISESWELMGSVKQGQSSAFCGICVIPSLKILYPISSYLWSDSYTLRLICKNGRFYGFYEQEKRQKRDTNWYNLALSCQSFPFDYPNVSIRPALEVDPQQKTSRGRTALAVAKDRWLGGDPWGLGNRWNRSQIWFRDDILQVVPM